MAVGMKGIIDKCPYMPNENPDDEQSCVKTWKDKYMQYGGTIVKIYVDKDGEKNLNPQIVVCGQQKVRMGWGDNIRRAYDSDFQSSQCSKSFPLDINNFNECNNGFDSEKPLVYCSRGDAPFCDSTTKTCVARMPENHLKISDWTQIQEPNCQPPKDESGYKQTLDTCWAPDGTKIPNCTEKSQTRDLVDKLKGCFRKELKKGGFTIEKVCLYQSVSKTFKKISDIEEFMKTNINQKKCVKYKPSGECLHYGFSKRLGLKCSTKQVIHEGVEGKNVGKCLYYYENENDRHANDSIILRSKDHDASENLFYRTKFESTSGASMYTRYLNIFARSVIDNCSLLYNGSDRWTYSKCNEEMEKNLGFHNPRLDQNTKKLKHHDLCATFDSDYHCVCLNGSGREPTNSAM